MVPSLRSSKASAQDLSLSTVGTARIPARPDLTASTAMERMSRPDVVHRQACDLCRKCDLPPSPPLRRYRLTVRHSCHSRTSVDYISADHRKVRCISSNGACQNCMQSGKRCTFSPRNSMGRPRKRTATEHLGGVPKRVPTRSTGDSDLILPQFSTSPQRREAFPSFYSSESPLGAETLNLSYGGSS